MASEDMAAVGHIDYYNNNGVLLSVGQRQAPSFFKFQNFNKKLVYFFMMLYK